MARQQSHTTPRGFQELEAIQPVVKALDQHRRYAIARQLLLREQDVALLRSKAEEVIAVNRVIELVGEGRLVQREEVSAMRAPHKLRRQLRQIQQQMPDHLGTTLAASNHGANPTGRVDGVQEVVVRME